MSDVTRSTKDPTKICHDAKRPKLWRRATTGSFHAQQQLLL